MKVVEIETGPVIAQYEVELEAGLRLAKISNLADDLAIALRVPSVRIVAPAAIVALLSIGAATAAYAADTDHKFEVYGFAQGDYIQDFSGRVAR